MKTILEYGRQHGAQKDLVRVRGDHKNMLDQASWRFAVCEAGWDTVDQPFSPTEQDLAFVRRQLQQRPLGAEDAARELPILHIWPEGVSDQDVCEIVARDLFAPQIEKLRTFEASLDPEIKSHRDRKRVSLDLIEQFAQLQFDANELTGRVEDLTSSIPEAETEPASSSCDEWWDSWSEGPFPLATVLRWREQGAAQFHNADGVMLEEYLASHEIIAVEPEEVESGEQAAVTVASEEQRSMNSFAEFAKSLASSLFGWLF